VRKTGTAGIKRHKTLTAVSGSLKYMYHLRSDSGSNGLVAKETVTASWSQAHFDFSEKTARTLPRICADNADQNKTTSTTETRRTATRVPRIDAKQSIAVFVERLGDFGNCQKLPWICADQSKTTSTTETQSHGEKQTLPLINSDTRITRYSRAGPVSIASCLISVNQR
jgi:hypothetical protein